MTVNPLLFWSICAMAVIGFAQALATVFKREPETGSLFEKPIAPEGFVWVLVPEADAARLQR
ncbi:hypothetical protein ACCC97_23665 [Variovorax sp. Varisp85]|uniref:hypothetical protein n=1 Tax=Variovorax sp. Varisp85 TaxID=3243059 RepID=UPI0039A50118